MSFKKQQKLVGQKTFTNANENEDVGLQPIVVEDGLFELVSEEEEGWNLKKLGVGALIGFFVCFLCGILSILCLLWSLAIAFNRTKRSEDSITPFVLANALSGIIAPFLFFISAFIGVNLIDYYTDHKIEAHSILTVLIPSLTYEVSKEVRYWVISDSLLMNTKMSKPKRGRRDSSSSSSFWKSCSPSYTTTLLSIIVALNVMVSFSYFIDISLVSQVSVNSCSDSSINIQYSCFKAGSLSPVNCASSNKTQPLHCYRFYRIGIDTDLITTTVTAFAFYLLSNRIFGGIIFTMKITRLSKRKLKCQGNMLIISGLVLLMVTAIIMIVWLTGIASVKFPLLAHFDILNMAQLAMMSLFILILGLLAHQGQWIEKRLARNKVVKFQKYDEKESAMA